MPLPQSLTAVLLIGLLTACGAGAQASTPPPPPVSRSAFNPTDAAWLDLIIPMDEQFLQILDLAPTHSQNPAVRRVAANLASSHRTELQELLALRTQAGLPTTNPHDGHDMPGMMTTDELLALSNLQGRPFDKTLGAEIQDHLSQSALITRSVKAAGRAPAVTSLASRIEKARSDQLVFFRASGVGHQTPLP